MVNIYDKATGTVYGTITEVQLQFLIDQFEEETSEDTDYYIDQITLDMLKRMGRMPACWRFTQGPRRPRRYGDSLVARVMATPNSPPD